MKGLIKCWRRNLAPPNRLLRKCAHSFRSASVWSRRRRRARSRRMEDEEVIETSPHPVPLPIGERESKASRPSAKTDGGLSPPRPPYQIIKSLKSANDQITSHPAQHDRGRGCSYRRSSRRRR